MKVQPGQHQETQETQPQRCNEVYEDGSPITAFGVQLYCQGLSQFFR